MLRLMLRNVSPSQVITKNFVRLSQQYNNTHLYFWVKREGSWELSALPPWIAHELGSLGPGPNALNISSPCIMYRVRNPLAINTFKSCDMTFFISQRVGGREKKESLIAG